MRCVSVEMRWTVFWLHVHDQKPKASTGATHCFHRANHNLRGRDGLSNHVFGPQKAHHAAAIFCSTLPVPRVVPKSRGGSCVDFLLTPRYC